MTIFYWNPIPQLLKKASGIFVNAFLGEDDFRVVYIL